MTPTTHRKRRIAILAAFGVLLVIAVVIALLVAQGSQSSWAKLKADLKARGEWAEWSEIIPEPVTPELNYFEHPVVKGLLPARGSTNAVIRKVGSSITNLAAARVTNSSGTAFTIVQLDGHPEFPQEVPLARPLEWNWLESLPRTRSEQGTNEFSLETLDEWFQQWTNVLAGLKEAAQRPHVYYEGNYLDPFAMPLPNFAAVRSLAEWSASRARINLLKGDSAAAMEDLVTSHAVMRALETEPRTLISAMVRCAMCRAYVEVVREGVNHGAWKAQELAAISERLRKINLIQDVQTSFREGERAGITKLFDHLAERKNSPRRAAALGALGSTPSWSLDALITRNAPKSWIRRNQVTHATLLQNFIDAMDGPKRRFYPAKQEAASDLVIKTFARWSPHTMLAAIATPDFMRAAITMARTQVSLDHAAIVCELELHKLKFNSYPNQLSEIKSMPAGSLPRDVIGGKDYGYRKTERGFVLYSVGLNEIDDGGIEGDSKMPDKKLDWLWQGESK